MSIGICPLVDYALKRLLGDEFHICITIHFLNSILVGQPRIRSARILNPARNKKNARGKLSVLDILAIDEQGRRLNIEVQTSIPAGMAQRLTYYVCVSYADQLQEGQNYTELRPSISICVLAGAMFSDVPKLHLEFRLREMSSDVTLTDNLQVHILQLNHLQITREMLYTATPAEQWAWFLRNVEDLTLEDVARLFPAPEFSEAAGVLQMIAQTPEELMEYRARLKYQRDEMARAQANEMAMQAVLEAARDAQLLAEARGEAVGEARGEARGILRGQIVVLQRLLKQPVWTDSEFAACSNDQLQTLADQLQTRVFAASPGIDIL